MKQTICPYCGEKENFHFNYDYTQKHIPIINVLCNECGEFFNSKEQQKKLITEIMNEDAKDGLYKFDYKNTSLLKIKTGRNFLYRLWFLISAPVIWLIKGEIKIK
jgi:hypothetical protein